MFDFGGGCVCCSPRGDVERRTRELMASAIKKKVPLDTIVLETTGVADPLVFAECCPRAFNARKALGFVFVWRRKPHHAKHLESTLKRQLDVATVVVSQRTTSSKASDPKEAVERILRAISSPSLSRPQYDGPKINDSKDPFARYPDLQEEKAIIHDKKVESYVLMAPGKVDVAACVEINLHAIEQTQLRRQTPRRWRGAPDMFDFHTGREGRGRLALAFEKTRRAAGQSRREAPRHATGVVARRQARRVFDR